MVRIRPKKHHGVKDPEKQQQKRLESVSGKINDPPRDPDDQPVPKSASRLAELMKRSSTSQIEKKKRRKSKNKSKQTSAFFNAIGVRVSQGKQESGKAFLQRVHNTSQKVLQEKKFEETFDVKVERDAITGEVIKLVNSKELSNTKASRKKEKRKSLKQSVSEKPKFVKKKKSKESLTSIEELKEKRDQILFGEIVHEPPTLTVPPKIAKRKESSLPGHRDLLLKNIEQIKDINSKSKTVGKSKATGKGKGSSKVKSPVASTVIDKTVKRKKLPIHVREQLEKEQKQVMDVYKTLKISKLMSKT